MSLIDAFRNARQQIQQDGFEKWLYAPTDGTAEVVETEEQALEGEWAEEDLKLRIRFARYAAIPIGFCLFGILSFFTTSWVAQLPIIWAPMFLPIITFAVITCRRGELRLGVKRPIRGYKARLIASLLVLASFFFAFLFHWLLIVIRLGN